MKERSRASAGGGIALVAVAASAALALAYALGASTSSAAPHHAPEDALAKARRLLEEGKPSEARALCLEELKRNPTSARVLRALAACARDSGDDEEATRLLERVVALDRKDASAWRQLAFAYRRAGRTMEALAAAETAMGLSPERDPALVQLVAKLMSAGPESPLARTSPGIPRAATPGMVDPMPHVPRPGAAPDARMLMNPR